MARRRLTPATLVEFAAAEPDLRPLAARLAARPSRGPARPRPVLRGRTPGRGRPRGRASAGRSSVGRPSRAPPSARAAGPAAEGVMAPVAAEPGPAWDALARAYEARWAEAPDEAAAHGVRRGPPGRGRGAARGPQPRAHPRRRPRARARGPARPAPCPGTRSVATRARPSARAWRAARLAVARRPLTRAPQRAARRRTASTGPPAASRGGRMRRPPFASRSFSAVARSILRCGRRAVPPGSVPRSRSVMTAG